MALTATAQSAFPRAKPMYNEWDEQIVPTLRKRLESESRTIAHRMSNASNHSSEDARASEGRGRKGGADLQNWGNGYQDPAGSSQSSLYDRHPPTHASSSRRDGRSNAPGHVGDTTTPKVNAARRTRQRTESQPAAFDGHARHRANGDTTPGPQKTSRDEEQFNFAVDARTNGQGVGATYQSQISPYATMTVGRFHIKNEEPPFDPNSVPSSSHSHAASEDDEAPPRASVESEERPFEHWYRGEVSRNGGVGELRVGRRKEMLDIANYGYTAKKNASRTPSAVDNGGRDPARRRRADSVAGIGERESVYMDEERARQLGLVMDEHPPTDIEGDSEQEQPYTWNARSQGYYQEPTPTRDQFSRPSLNDRANSPSNIGLPPTRIPAPASPRAGTPPQRRGALEPVPDPSTPKASRPFSPPQETPKASESANKRRRGTTPPVASASKKAKGKSPARTIQKTQDRGSVAYYPTPNGDNMEDAIPTWSQPVQGGNWDEVVPPAVARKRGLNGLYETSDGRSQSPPRKDETAPAPGTFGFDHTKYKPPREDGEDVPMSELGERAFPPNSAPHRQSRYPQDQPYGRHPISAPSPPPFAAYRVDGYPHSAPVAPSKREDKPSAQADEHDAGGCCKCIIM